MTEELVEKLTPSKEMEERDAEERNKILEGVGEVCMVQRQYHLATKKFTQCGNRVKVCLSSHHAHQGYTDSGESVVGCN